ncbi:hypothetical protein ACN4EE_09890 [Geminocystis sp. CENA526]|uniref:hypothetical protein n=1 Tax=Geminocystis sp. CENA526 TaxID=1355871 RepID=UPI003D6F6865
MPLLDIRVSKNWQPIRIVNKEKIAYENNNENYLYMIAELVLKIVQKKDEEGFKKINLRLYPASRFAKNEEYEEKIETILRFLQVRQEKIINFNLTRVKQQLAKNHRLLQIADLLSNGSYRSYGRLNQELKEIMKDTFGDYNFTLIVPLFSQRIESLLQEQAYGFALRFILVEINLPNNKNQALEFLNNVIDNLVKLPYSERNAHLNYLISWLEQEINQKRGLESGYLLAENIEKNVYQKLAEKLREKNQENNVIWFKYAIHYWALTAYNHSGKLFKASQEVQKLDELKSQLYHQIEHLSLFMEGLVAKAVHYTDRFDFEKAIQETEFIIDFYDSFFSEGMKEFFALIIDNDDSDNAIKSDLRAKGLGTCLQAQIYQYLQNNDAELLTKARSNSEKAIAEFVALNDKKRQYQYRCQLEAVAGNFNISRQYLAKSLDLKEESSYLEIMQHIKQLDISFQGFSLLHLFRLGYQSYFKNEFDEWGIFRKALEDSKLLINPWFLTSDYSNYPIHGILRRVVSFAVIMGDKQKAQQALGRLNNLKPITISPILGLIHIATYLEYAGLIWTGELTNDFNNIIANNDRTKVTITSLIGQLRNDDFAKIRAFKTEVEETITAIQIDRNNVVDVKKALLKLGNQIGY